MFGLRLGAAAAALSVMAGAAAAATITFDAAQPGSLDGYSSDGFAFAGNGNIVNGNCPAAPSGAPCGRLNKNETVVLATDPGGDLFSLSSLDVTLQGRNAVLTLTTDKGSYDITQEGTIDLTGVAALQGVDSVSFFFTDNARPGRGGTVRFDDIMAVAAVPLPAAGLLLLGGLGALAGARRRRRA